MSKTLKLVLKKKWYDMILSGVKKEEYREIKDYYKSRIEGKDIGRVEFKLGYQKNAPKMVVECLGIEKREGNPDWGAVEGEKYYVIKLGEIITGNNTVGGIYRMDIDFGRQGRLEGVFYASKKAVEQLINEKRNIYFGEVLGKHSEVCGSLESTDITLVSDNPKVIEIFNKYNFSSGHNPFWYIDDEE